MASLFYIRSNTKPGPESDSIHVSSGDAAYQRPIGECTMPITVIDETAFGDYLGGSVEASNHRVILADKEMAAVVYRLIGSHGYQALAYAGDGEPPEALREALEGLSDYPIISDDDHSALEMTMEEEAWADWGRKDFQKAMGKALDEIDAPHDHEVPDEMADRLWHYGVDALNINGGSGIVIETGCLVHFYIDEFIKKFRNNPYKIWKNYEKYYAANASEGDKAPPTLGELAEICRIAE